TVHPTHLIRNPEPERTIRYNEPNACNLCHLQRSVNWSVEQEQRLWGGAPRPRGPAQFDQPEALRALALGDVVYRTILLYQIQKQRLHGLDGLLLAGLQDPYSSVRRFSAQALTTIRAEALSEEALEQTLRSEGVQVPAELQGLRSA